MTRSTVPQSGEFPGFSCTAFSAMVAAMDAFSTLLKIRAALFRYVHTGRMTQRRFRLLNQRVAAFSAVKAMCGVVLPDL